MDGLRAIAVLGVVFYHLDLPWLPGGFLGVDVFFVLSGFLITTLVLEEIERTGRLSLRSFYLRRARRLLPALLLVLAVMSLLAVIVLPEELAELRRDVVGALLYVSNWTYVFSDQSYFEAAGRPPLLQHLWSLAVEEQFYLLWPAVVAAAMVAGRRRVRRIAVCCALLSASWMAALAMLNGYPVPNDPSRAYFGTDTHAAGLLLGAAVATFWAPWRVWSTDSSWLTSSRPVNQRAGTAIVDLAGVLALIGIVWTFLSVGEFSPFLYRGGFLALAACTVVLVAALAHPAALLGRVLAVQPLRYLGERSYGIYLWHWPLALLTRPGFELPFGGWPSVLLRLGLILAAAELSYRFVERPIREGALGELARRMRTSSAEPARSRAKVVGGGFAVAVGLTTIGVALFIAPASTGSPTDEAGYVQPRPGPATAAEQPGQDAEEQAGDHADGAEQSDPGLRADRGEISVFGDSVVYGAAYQLRAAGARVSAAEGRQFADVLAKLADARDRGALGGTVIVHAGNNGPVDEEALDEALAALADHDVYLATLHVPRSWETYNNELFARMASRYAHVTLLDWDEKVSSQVGWLYPDGTHLTAEQGRDGYAKWMLRSVRE